MFQVKDKKKDDKCIPKVRRHDCGDYEEDIEVKEEMAKPHPPALEKRELPLNVKAAKTRLLIKNGTVVNCDSVENADVFIENGVIREVGPNLMPPGGTYTIDAKNLLVIPGGIDPHTHFELDFMGEKSVDDFYHGTKAAVTGGTTMIMDFVLPQEGESLRAAYNRYRTMADKAVCCDYSLHVGLTSWSSEMIPEMKNLVDECGVNSFKFFMAYKDTMMLRDNEIYELMEACKELKALPMVHAENGDIIKENSKRLLAKGIVGIEGHGLSRAEEVEAEAVYRASIIANQVQCPLYVVHVMGTMAGNVLAERRSILQRTNSKYPLIGETLAAAVGTYWKGTESLEMQAARIMSPPLRPDPATPTNLIKLLATGVLKTVGSDNCTFTIEQKRNHMEVFTQIPNGLNGVEDRMSIVWDKGVRSNIISPSTFVAITSSNAAKIFNVYPRKGRIAVGSSADVVVWNPEKRRTISALTHQHKTDINIFEGMSVYGVPEHVIVKGALLIENREWRSIPTGGSGGFIPNRPNAPFCYDDEREDGESNEGQEEGESGGGSENPPLEPDSDALAREIQALSLDRSESDDNSTMFGYAASHRTGRQMRQQGQRDLHSSSFSVASYGGQTEAAKTSIRVRGPPGGQSSGFW